MRRPWCSIPLGPWLVALALWSPIPIGLSLSRTVRAADAPSPATEDHEQQARRHYVDGEAAFKAGQYQRAMSEFEAGYAAAPRPGFLLNMAHTARKLGDLRKSRSLYKKYLLMDPTSKVREDVQAVIAELDSALADEDAAAPNRSAAREPAPTRPAQAEPVVLPRATPPPDETPALVASAPAPEERESASPFYRRPWFWVTVGVVAVAGGAVAIYAAQRSSGDPFHPNGSLGSLGP
jgi:tetratricopeptide (TPR) repeat protein